MIIAKFIVFVVAAFIGGFSFGPLFNTAIACVAGFILLGAVEPGWGRVIALAPPLGLFWLVSSFFLPGLFPWGTGLLQVLAFIFVFGVPLDVFPCDTPRRPKRSRALVLRDDDVIDAEIIDD